MRVYLSARFSRAQEMRDVRDVLKQLGHTVTSRWIDAEQTPEKDKLRLTQAVAEQNAIGALEDITKSDIVVSFTGNGGANKRAEKGGRHCEFMAGVVLNKPSVVIGSPDHAFHWLPNVERYASLDEFIDSLETD